MDQKSGTGKYERLLARCTKLEPIPTAVAHPCEEHSTPLERLRRRNRS